MNNLTPETVLSSPEFDRASTQLAQVGRFFAQQGWSPATSSNYSLKLSDSLFAISRTGVDKFNMNASDIIVINEKAEVVAPKEAKSSAETLIHKAIYENRKPATSVLHTHSVNNTRMSLKFADQGSLVFRGYEIQKGLNGVLSHEDKIQIPILANSQDMKAFYSATCRLLQENTQIHGFLIAGHGLYTWGQNLAEAKRHVETFEFLFSCLASELAGA